MVAHSVLGCCKFGFCQTACYSRNSTVKCSSQWANVGFVLHRVKHQITRYLCCFLQRKAKIYRNEFLHSWAHNRITTVVSGECNLVLHGIASVITSPNRKSHNRNYFNRTSTLQTCPLHPSKDTLWETTKYDLL